MGQLNLYEVFPAGPASAAFTLMQLPLPGSGAPQYLGAGGAFGATPTLVGLTVFAPVAGQVGTVGYLAYSPPAAVVAGYYALTFYDTTNAASPLPLDTRTIYYDGTGDLSAGPGGSGGSFPAQAPSGWLGAGSFAAGVLPANFADLAIDPTTGGVTADVVTPAALAQVVAAVFAQAIDGVSFLAATRAIAADAAGSIAQSADGTSTTISGIGSATPRIVATNTATTRTVTLP